MAKSAGNFFTVRDLVLMGHKPSSIRFLLMSVPYRKQLNFTFDGLTQAANSVERLRNFKRRLETSQFPAGSNTAIVALAEKASTEMRAAMEEDLNTARALGAIFDLVRDANAAADNGQVHQDDVPKLLKVLEQFEEIFAVLKTTTQPKSAQPSNGRRRKAGQTRSALRQKNSQKLPRSPTRMWRN